MENHLAEDIIMLKDLIKRYGRKEVYEVINLLGTDSVSEENKLCFSCGLTQSYPIPHEHDRTEREEAIINYYKEREGVIHIPDVAIDPDDFVKEEGSP